ncbi:MAG: hypothetical protein EP338_01395 [Bacteroidetes bacterium]|nr:MAG: hypothetical protein EP338_01395 [Bacteroidota bacterium]
MDYDVELRFQNLTQKLELVFGEGLDVQAILFLIGVQELGQGYRKFKKHEKTDLMHVAICTLLEPHGYYQYKGRDEDLWPHFELIQQLPPLNERSQQHLIKEAILDYFEENEIFEGPEAREQH